MIAVVAACGSKSSLNSPLAWPSANRAWTAGTGSTGSSGRSPAGLERLASRSRGDDYLALELPPDRQLRDVVPRVTVCADACLGASLTSGLERRGERLG